MQVVVVPATEEDRGALDQLDQLCRYDASEACGCDVDGSGRFAAPSLDDVHGGSGRHAFLIRADGQLAGFARVQSGALAGASHDGHIVSVLFILRKYRRRGVGRAAALQLFGSFPGRWEIRTPAYNIPCQAFWRGVLQQYTSGRYDERWVQDGPLRGQVQRFVAPPSDAGL